MRQIKKILAVLNPTSEGQAALDKAIFVSQRIGAEITALVSRNNASPEFIGSLDARLSALAMEGIKVTLEVSDEKDTLRAILRSQHSSACDLTIKEPHPASLGNPLFTPLDWKLLRTNISPVLMTRSEQTSTEGPIIASVDARPSDHEHQRLNTAIMRTGDLISRLFARPLHLVTAHPSPMQDAARKDQVPVLLEQEYRGACEALAAPYAIKPEHIHVAPGPAEHLLPQLAGEFDARLLILGTVARSGLQGALLGNTAEQILRQVKTDVLVLSPPSVI